MQTILQPDQQSVAQAFADHLVQRLGEKHPFRLVLSGGSTPRLLFQLLAESYRERIDWSRLHLFWCDERCVPPDDEESNYRTARELLLSRVPIPESQVHRIRGEAPPEEEAERYSDLIDKETPRVNGWPRFDLIMLGMGADGHTASIFPDQMQLLDSEAICGLARHPESGQQRVTLTGGVLNNAAEVAFLVTGADKAERVREVLAREGEWKRYPAAHIQPTEGEVLWFLDAAAGREL